MSTAGTENPSGRSLKGLELSEQYYHALVEPAIRETCPEALPHLAAGLVGEGSDCFGFDDEVSKDHDWGPRVCLWLQDAAYERFFHVLSSTLASLPDTFRGERFALRTPEAAGRQGVLRTGEFYSSFTGSPEGPRSFQDWLSLPESHLAACTNGKVFYDGPGRFSMIRHHILNGCPEDVWRKRLAARIALMAQSGQYNFLRCLKHGEPVAAFLALSEFLQHGLAACVASDAHNPKRRSTNMLDVRGLLLEEYGEAYMRLLLEENPKRILDGRALLGYEPIPFR